MKYLRGTLFGILAIFLVVTCHAGRPIPSVAAANNPNNSNNSNNLSLAPMLQKVMSSVVNIAARGEIPNDNPLRQNNAKPGQKFEDLGSGVIIDAEHGYIVTNAHVIKDSQVVTVTLSDGRSIMAKIIGYDTISDIAVLQINTKHLKDITFGDSDKIKVGDFVCAIGSPFGLQQTVTYGVVSGLERSEFGTGGFESYIQTDASINPGSSGGALIDMKGKLIGINTALVGAVPASAGVGLSIPSNITKNIVEQLIKYGKVRRGVMGVLVQNVTPALAEVMKLPEGGALIAQVIDGSPAAAAGLQAKDIIVKIMGKPVHSATQLTGIASLLNIGSEAVLQVRRDNKLITIKPIIADPEDLKKAQETTSKNLLSGLGLKNINLLIDNQQIKGIEVLYVDDASAAYNSGLSHGDVIIAAANQPVTEIGQLQAIANKKPKQLLLKIKRGLTNNFFLVLEE